MAFHFVFLTQQFFNDYSHCTEIEQKTERPYVRMLLRIEGIDFAIPMRTNIKHPNAYITDKVNNCGIDYSKAVVISDPALYIDSSRHPYIRTSEFESLRGKEYLVEQGMRRYLAQYKKALQKPLNYRNALLLRFSTLQYFHVYILKSPI